MHLWSEEKKTFLIPLSKFLIKLNKEIKILIRVKNNKMYES